MCGGRGRGGVCVCVCVCVRVREYVWRQGLVKAGLHAGELTHGVCYVFACCGVV